MQEQQPYKITPDQAWEKMKPILDQAMPVMPASRRLPFVWWSVSTIVVAAFTGMFFFTDGPSTTQRPADTMEKTIPPSAEIHPEDKRAQMNSDVPSNPSKETDTILFAPIKISSDKPDLSTTSQESEDKPAQSAKGTSGHSKKPVTKENAIPMALSDDHKDHELVLSPSLQMEDVSNQIGMNDVSADEEWTTGMVILDDQAPRNVQVIDPLPLPSPNAIDALLDDKEQITPGKAMKGIRNPSFIQPTIAASGLAGLNGGFGLFAGAGADLNINRRFSVTTSVGYLQYHPNSFLRGDLASLDANAEYNWIVNYDPAIPGNETYVAAENVNNKASYNAIHPLVDKISQWQVAAGLKWRMTPRFFTEAGVQFGLSTQAYSEYPIISFDPLANPVSGTRINNSLNDYNIIRTNTTSWYLGIGYRIAQHFEVYTNWTHGLNQYILNDTANATEDMQQEDRTDYIRGLSLGLRYTL